MFCLPSYSPRYLVFMPEHSTSICTSRPQRLARNSPGAGAENELLPFSSISTERTFYCTPQDPATMATLTPIHEYPHSPLLSPNIPPSSLIHLPTTHTPHPHTLLTKPSRRLPLLHRLRPHKLLPSIRPLGEKNRHQTRRRHLRLHPQKPQRRNSLLAHRPQRGGRRQQG
jgi:hypothetical protein